MYNMSCTEMTSKVGVAHNISHALTRAVYLAPPYSQSWIRPCGGGGTHEEGVYIACRRGGSTEEGVYIAYGWGIHRVLRGYTKRGYTFRVEEVYIACGGGGTHEEGYTFVWRGIHRVYRGWYSRRGGILFVWRWWYSREEGVHINF